MAKQYILFTSKYSTSAGPLDLMSDPDLEHFVDGGYTIHSWHVAELSRRRGIIQVYFLLENGDDPDTAATIGV